VLDCSTHGIRKRPDEDVEQGSRHFAFVCGDVGIDAGYCVVQLVAERRCEEEKVQQEKDYWIFHSGKGYYMMK